MLSHHPFPTSPTPSPPRESRRPRPPLPRAQTEAAAKGPGERAETLPADLHVVHFLQPLLVRNSVGLHVADDGSNGSLAAVDRKLAACLRYQASALAQADRQGAFLAWCRARQQAPSPPVREIPSQLGAPLAFSTF